MLCYVSNLMESWCELASGARWSLGKIFLGGSKTSHCRASDDSLYVLKSMDWKARSTKEQKQDLMTICPSLPESPTGAPRALASTWTCTVLAGGCSQRGGSKPCAARLSDTALMCLVPSRPC